MECAESTLPTGPSIAQEFPHGTLRWINYTSAQEIDRQAQEIHNLTDQVNHLLVRFNLVEQEFNHFVDCHWNPMQHAFLDVFGVGCFACGTSSFSQVSPGSGLPPSPISPSSSSSSIPSLESLTSSSTGSEDQEGKQDKGSACSSQEQEAASEDEVEAGDCQASGEVWRINGE